MLSHTVWGCKGYFEYEKWPKLSLEYDEYEWVWMMATMHPIMGLLRSSSTLLTPNGGETQAASIISCPTLLTPKIHCKYSIVPFSKNWQYKIRMSAVYSSDNENVTVFQLYWPQKYSTFVLTHKIQNKEYKIQN